MCFRDLFIYFKNMFKKMFFVVLMFLMTSSVAFASFVDVPDDYYSVNSINWMQEQGVVEGYSDGTFRPENKVNRAEFLKMLYETVGMNGQEVQFSFPDVPESEWYSKYVKEAYANGIVDGYPDGTFRPGAYINFAEAIKIIANAFFDVDVLYGGALEYEWCLSDFESYSNEWYWPFVFVADSYCVIPNYYGFNFALEVSRADMVEMLYRAKAVSDNSNVRFMDYIEGPNIKPDDIVSLCTDAPIATDIGSHLYPIDPKYGELNKLGQLFTAADCGQVRLNEFTGGSSDYTLGSRILLNDIPSEDFLTVFSSIGFECAVGSDCTEITLSNIVTLDEILLLQPYYFEMSVDDCVNCG